MRLLITNDDGVNSAGLWALIERARSCSGVQVTVVAPDRERSATGHAISIHQPIEVCEIESEDGERVYSASGTPADCVKLAVEAHERTARFPDFRHKPRAQPGDRRFTPAPCPPRLRGRCSGLNPWRSPLRRLRTSTTPLLPISLSSRL